MGTEEVTTPWLVRFKASPQARVRLFCFPYAGGAAHIFRTWPQRLPGFVDLWAVQPPGRGNRLRERPLMTLNELVAAAAPAFYPFRDRPFVFFGHSMGAMIAFELTRRLREAGRGMPARLLLSGCRAPQLAHARAITYDLPDPEFLAEIRRLKGTPAEVLDNPELLQFVLPLLRADFAVTQTYEYTEGPPLTCPFTVFGGVEDGEVGREMLVAWREHTAASFSLHMLPGGHFFLHSSQDLLLKVISEELERSPLVSHERDT